MKRWAVSTEGSGWSMRERGEKVGYAGEARLQFVLHLRVQVDNVQVVGNAQILSWDEKPRKLYVE